MDAYNCPADADDDVSAATPPISLAALLGLLGDGESFQDCLVICADRHVLRMLEKPLQSARLVPISSVQSPLR